MALRRSDTPGSLERRFHAGVLEVRADGDGLPRITGITAPINQETIIGRWAPYREVIRPGAFARAIKEKQDVRALYNHEPSTVFARTQNTTLTLREEPNGLYFEAEPVDTPDVRAMIERIKRGDVSGCSFMFRIIKDRWTFDAEDEANDLREILDVDLFDVGPVTFPAYPTTSVDARASGAHHDTHAHRVARLQHRMDRLSRSR